MTTIKSFFTAVLKISFAIALAVLVVALAGWGIYSFNQHQENERNAPLGKPHIWSTISVPSLNNSAFTLSTVWRDGQLSYQFEMSGFPKSLETAINNGNANFTITFLDENGFKLGDHKINGTDIIRVIDDKGKPAGISSKGQTYLNSDTYRKAKSWEVTWNF